MRTRLSALAIVFLAFAFLASAVGATPGPTTPALAPAVQAPAASPVTGAPQPVPMAAYPICPSGYFTIDQECQTCGTRPPFGGKSCTTCENIWTGDQFTTCSQCDFINGCPQF